MRKDKEIERVWQKMYYWETKGRVRAFDREQRAATSAKWRAEHPLEMRFNSTKSRAKYRKLEFTLSFAEFSAGCNEDCHYCGSYMVAGGLDRVDNAKGYVAGNVVPCCIICNRMKRDYPLEKFLAHVRLIVFRNAVKNPLTPEHKSVTIHP